MIGDPQRSHTPRPRALRTLLGPIAILAIMLANLMVVARPAYAVSPNVVISQVYGGGGNSGATLTNDFVELYNRSTSAVSLTGWSVQYASSTGSSWSMATTPLAGSIAPGGYYLVQQAKGAGGTTALPTPDATGTIAMSGTAGKVALVNSTTALSGNCPTTNAVDFVGYGTSTNCSEGTPTGTLSNTTAALRNGNGATDTDNNGADFTIGAPNPRNSGTIITPPPPPDCSAPDTPIGQVQGSGAATPVADTTVTVQGVVVGDYEGASPALRGFYLQDTGDGNTATSDGIFVFEGDSADRVAVGQVVQVTGVASEFQGQTQISSTTGVVTCGSTNTLAPVDLDLPFASADAAEAYEGMLVRFPETLYVTEHFQLGRFGQVVLSSGGRLRQPTNVAAPGASALALQAANNLNRLIVDDASQVQNPDPILFGRDQQPLSAANTLRGGDSVTGIQGVLTYTWGGNSASPNAYRLRPIGALGTVLPDFEPTNPRPAPPATPGALRVTAANLLNYFDTFGTACTQGVGGAATNCRGAENQAEFDRQWPKTVAALVGAGADVIGIMELENDGYGPTSAIQHLVDKLNAATAPGTYAFIDADALTGQVNALGTDAIKVAILYKPARATPVGTTAALNSEAFVNGGDGAARNRPSLAQAFEDNATGGRFVFDVNHLKSKGSPCEVPDAGDGQGNCNAVRTTSANLLTDWLASDPTGIDDPDVMIAGDLNSYAMEDPITAITDDGYTNLILDRIGEDGYSYAFDGQWGYLDHALATGSLATQVTSVSEYHINADEPSVLDYNTNFKSAGQIGSLYAPDQFRVSDHDPIIVDLNLTPPNQEPDVDAGGPYNVDEGGSVTLTATGSDPENGTLTYAWDLDNDGSYETAGQSVSFSAANLDGPTSRTVAVQVTDNGGLSAVDQATVNVVNVAPTVAAPLVVPEPSKLGKPALAGARFSDPAGANDAPYTCTVDYGDGSGQQRGAVRDTTCAGPAHTYTRIGSFTVTVRVTDQDGATGSASVVHRVIYNWNGFFTPIDNLPKVNKANSGSSVPIKFSLNGDQGRAIFAAGYPASQPISCSTGQPTGSLTPIVTNGQLSYARGSDTYSIVWKTDKRWSNTCRDLVVQLNDGTQHRARFNFNK